MSTIEIHKLAYTIPEACDAVGLSRSTIYALIAQGRLARRKIGKRTLIPTESLRALIADEE